MDNGSFIKSVFEAAELKKQNEQLREMLAMQTKLVVNLELEKIQLADKLKHYEKAD